MRIQIEEGVVKDSVKLMGGLGSLFIVLGVIPYIGALLSLAGFVLLIIAIKNYSEEEGRPELVSKLVKGIVISFIGELLGGVVAGVGAGMYGEGHGLVGGALAGIGFLIIYIASIFGYNFIKDVFTEIALLTGNNLFDWAGKLMFWGALLLIILIGGALIWVGWIVATAAFFTTQPIENK
jgi:uncharacterized membrane protein